MRTITLDIYKFEELSAPAQAKAIEENRYYEIERGGWAEPIIEDAAQTADLKIYEFDILHTRVSALFITDARESAECIIYHHDPCSDTYFIANTFIYRLDSLEQQEDTAKTETDIEECIEDFASALKMAYGQLLNRHYDYLTSDEGVQEYLSDSDFKFTADGARYYDKK